MSIVVSKWKCDRKNMNEKKDRPIGAWGESVALHNSNLDWIYNVCYDITPKNQGNPNTPNAKTMD
jgi:hypothetical protein